MPRKAPEILEGSADVFVNEYGELVQEKPSKKTGVKLRPATWY